MAVTPAERPCTNITPAISEVFNALRNPEYSNFALFSCFVNGQPAAAIVAINRADGGQFDITPLFVSITPEMDLTDHDGVSCRDLGLNEKRG